MEVSLPWIAMIGNVTDNPVSFLLPLFQVPEQTMDIVTPKNRLEHPAERRTIKFEHLILKG